jgi:protein tyrosine/serine phosphatase
MVDASRFLGVYDIELIYSWTPREYKNFIKGAKHREIDTLENEAISALFHRKASSEKRITLKKLFDADKAHKRLENNDNNYKDSRDVAVKQKQYKRMKQALKGYAPTFTKGGNT